MADQQPPPGFVPMAEPAPPLGFVLVNEAKKRGMDIFPNWLQDLAKYGPGFAKESGKMLGRGAATLGANLAEGAGNLAGEGMRSPNITNSPTPQQDIARALPDSLSDSPIDQRFRRTMEGTGAGLLLPVPGAGIVTSGLVGAGSGLGGALGRQTAETFAPKSPGVQATGDILGSIFGGGLGALTFGPKQSVAQQDIRKALTGTTPEGYQQAAANARQSQAVGSTTATGAEMFPPNSGIVALGDKVRGSASDNPLRLQTTDRPTDLKGLADEFLNRIGPAVDPNRVANATADSANATLATTKALRGTALSNRLAGEAVPFNAVEGLHKDLMHLGKLENRPEAGDAFRLVASKLLDQTQQPITDVQQLSLAIKSLKEAAKNPNSPIFSGRNITGQDLTHAINTAEAGLGELSPAFQGGMQDFRAFSQGPMAAERVGPIGSLADRNPLQAGQTSVARLDALLSGNSPQTINSTARSLGDRTLTGGNPTSPLDIARALAQQKLAGVGTNKSADIGGLMRGGMGSDAENKFAALLRAGGNDAEQTLAPLATGDRLQAYAQPAGLNPPTVMEKMQLLIRPLRTLDMMTTGRGINKTNAEIGRLLADRSPEGMRRLQEIGMFDPAVRRALTGRALLAPLDQEQ